MNEGDLAHRSKLVTRRYSMKPFIGHGRIFSIYKMIEWATLENNISTFIWPFGIIKRIFLTYSEINPTLLLLLEPRLPCDMKKRYQFFSTLSSYQKLSKYICLFPIDIVFTRTCADCKERRAENIIMKLGMVLNGMVLNELFCFWSKKAAKIKPDTFICLNLHCQGPTQ